MFKNLEKAFEGKKNRLSKQADKNQRIFTELKVFLEEEFGKKLATISLKVNYNSGENSLAITTDNKILANELAIRLAKLNTFLEKRNIIVDKILVR